MSIIEDINNVGMTSFENVVIIVEHIDEYFGVLSSANHFQIW